MGKRIQRSREEWFQIAMECRRSGLSDKDWCTVHDIGYEGLKSALKRLKKEGVSVPKRSEIKSAEYFDLTAASRPEPVQIHLVPDNAILCPVPASSPGSQIVDAMEICINGASVRIPNGTDPGLLSQALLCLMGAAC